MQEVGSWRLKATALTKTPLREVSSQLKWPINPLLISLWRGGRAPKVRFCPVQGLTQTHVDSPTGRTFHVFLTRWKLKFY